MIKINITGNNIQITFPFNMKVLAILKEFSQKEFNYEQNIWILPTTCFRKMQQRFEQEKLEYKVFGEIKDPEINVLKTPLFQHQKDFLVLYKDMNVVFLGDEQGLGKTLSSIAAAIEKKSKTGHCLIVVGVNGLKYNWKAEIETHSNEQCIVLGDRLLTRGPRKGLTREGSTEEKFEDLKSMPEPYFWIVNIETLRNKKFANVKVG